MNSPGSDGAAWCDAVLEGSSPLPSSATVRCVTATIDGSEAVVAAWDFTHQGGSFGAADADAFVGATAIAIEHRLPLVSLLRSGGTRLPEGMRALVGIPRSALALARLRAAHLPHISVADHPTTGGVWVGIGSTADIRIAVEGAVVGFSGPRAVTAMTGRELAADANTAAAAHRAGLVDALASPDAVIPLIGRALRALTAEAPTPSVPPAVATPAARDAWEQVTASRSGSRPGGHGLIESMVSGSVTLAGADGTVAAAVGHLEGRRVVAAAVAADRSLMPTPAGYSLLARAASLAGALDLPLVVLVDTPGADPHTESLGLAASIATAMTAVLDCPAPTISLVHGEGGSGGALAGAVTDVVGIGEHAWFAAMGPEGAAATLRIEASEAARQMSITPADLLATGFGDAFVPADLAVGWLATTIDWLAQQPAAERLERRRARWSAPLRGQS
jgi:acetyl-CoA carboxylase carboxyl transferase subunit beta